MSTHSSRNMPIVAKYNVYISAVQLFYIQACPDFLSISKLIVYLSDSRVSIFSILGPVLSTWVRLFEYVALSTVLEYLVS